NARVLSTAAASDASVFATTSAAFVARSVKGIAFHADASFIGSGGALTGSGAFAAGASDFDAGVGAFESPHAASVAASDMTRARFFKRGLLLGAATLTHPPSDHVVVVAGSPSSQLVLLPIRVGVETEVEDLPVHIRPGDPGELRGAADVAVRHAEELVHVRHLRETDDLAQAVLRRGRREPAVVGALAQPRRDAALRRLRRLRRRGPSDGRRLRGLDARRVADGPRPLRRRRARERLR